jgi:phosphoglycerate kinase
VGRLIHPRYRITKDEDELPDIKQADFKDRRALMRVEFNLPIEIEKEELSKIKWEKDKDGKYKPKNIKDIKFKIKDDSRMVETLPSIKHILSQKGNKGLVLLMHFEPKIKAPDGTEIKVKLSTQELSEHLKKLLPEYAEGIKFEEGSINKKGVSEEALKVSQSLKENEILVMENVRDCQWEKKDIDELEGEEKSKAMKFVNDLLKMGDIYVQEAFGVVHRKNISMILSRWKESYLGILVSNEVKYLSKLKELDCGICAGSKVKDKIKAIDGCLMHMDKGSSLLIAGKMAYSFIIAKEELDREKELSNEEMINLLGKAGEKIDRDDIEAAKEKLREAERKGVEVILPVDYVGVKELKEGASARRNRRERERYNIS